MLIERTRDWNFTMNSEADSATFFHLASPPRSPNSSPILPTSQHTASSTSHHRVNDSSAYNVDIIPTIGIKVLSAILAFFAFGALILNEHGISSSIVAEILLLLQSLWNILIIARYYLRDLQGRHGNEANEKKIRLVDIGLIAGLTLALSVGYFLSNGWYYSGWNLFWGYSLGLIVVTTQTIVIFGRHKLDKRKIRVYVRIRLEENVEE